MDKAIKEFMEDFRKTFTKKFYKGKEGQRKLAEKRNQWMQFFDNTVEELYSRNISSWIKFYSFIIKYRGINFNEALNIWRFYLTKKQKTEFSSTG